MNAHDNSITASSSITMREVLAAQQALQLTDRDIFARGVVSRAQFYKKKGDASYVVPGQTAAQALVAEAAASAGNMPPEKPAKAPKPRKAQKPAKNPAPAKTAADAEPVADQSADPDTTSAADGGAPAGAPAGSSGPEDATTGDGEPATDGEPAPDGEAGEDIVIGGGAARQVIRDAEREIAKLGDKDVDGADLIIKRLIDAGASTAQGVSIINLIAEKLKGTATKAQVDRLWREAAKEAAMQLRLQTQAQNGGDDGRGNQTEHLFDLTEAAGYEAWRDGRTGRGCVTTGPGHHLVLGSQAANDAMRRLYHSDPLPGRRVPNGDSVAAVSALYSAQVAEDDATRRTSLRYGGVFNEQHTLVGVVIDNGDARRTATYVTATGVAQIEGDTIDALGVYFVRSSDILPFPASDFDGNFILAIKKLRDLVSTRSFDDAMALFGVLVAEMLPGAHTLPVLALDGPPGSGKTSAARFLKQLLDPASDDAGGAPKSIEDFYVSAGDARVMVIDNLNKMGVDLSDAICRVASGGTVPKRALFSDATKHLSHVHAAIILTTIELWLASRPDIIERLVKLRLAKPKMRRSDAETARIAKENAPYIIGALRAALQLVLANIDWKGDTKGDRLTTTRLVLTALDKALGEKYPDHKFLDAYDSMRRDGATVSAMSNPLLLAVAGVALQSTPDAAGTYKIDVLTSTLHDRIRQFKPNEKCFWPETSAALGRTLAASTHMMGLADIGFNQKQKAAGTYCQIEIKADAAARLRVAASHQGMLFKNLAGDPNNAGDIDEASRLCSDIYAARDGAMTTDGLKFIEATIEAYLREQKLKTLRQSTPLHLPALRTLLETIEKLSADDEGDEI